MTNPNLNAQQLNDLLVPKSLYGKSQSSQISILTSNCTGVRNSLLGLYFRLQGSTNRAPSRVIVLLYVLTRTGTSFALTPRQQFSLYNYLNANRSSGLAYLMFQARQIQQRNQYYAQRSIVQP
jgi:hypothetical protein